MISVAFCIPGDITLETGGYRYDREVLARFAAHGISVTHIALPGAYPEPTEPENAQTHAILKAIDRKTIVLVDGLAAGAMPPDLLKCLPNKVVALVHHPLGLEAGLAEERAQFLLANEKAVLAGVDHVIVTSTLTARTLLQEFDVPHHRLTVAEPGTPKAARSKGTSQPVQILAVGAVSHRKAYDLLVACLAPLQQLGWNLTIAGSLDRSPDAVANLREVIADHQLEKRVTLAGAISDTALSGLYAKADLFAMSSLYEGYGMALAEALAHGLPIVTSSGGAAAETVPDTAAIKVPPGNQTLLSQALARAITDPLLRRRMGDAAWAAAALLPNWDDTTREIADALKSIA